jgi:hypothetical protein
MPAMNGVDLAHWRMRNLRLWGAPLERPEEVVGWLVGVQSQDYGPAKWALGQRTGGADDAAVQRAFAVEAVLRTHVLRPTWLFVLPADIRWLQELTAPRVHVLNGYAYRQLGLDEGLLRKATALLVEALRGGNQLTRKALGARLEAARWPATGSAPSAALGAGRGGPLRPVRRPAGRRPAGRRGPLRGVPRPGRHGDDQPVVSCLAPGERDRRDQQEGEREADRPLGAPVLGDAAEGGAAGGPGRGGGEDHDGAGRRDRQRRRDGRRVGREEGADRGEREQPRLGVANWKAAPPSTPRGRETALRSAPWLLAILTAR